MEKIAIKPTESELEILQLLWENHPATVRSINDTLNEKREVGYTTTLKTMQNMLDKGLLLREIVEKSHFYSPAIPQEITQEQVLRNVAEAAFGGSTSSLVMRALGSGSTTKEELEQIKMMLEKLSPSSNTIIP
jgi:BlaI family transcriptional regulator, penicillinase repressor